MQHKNIKNTYMTINNFDNFWAKYRTEVFENILKN